MMEGATKLARAFAAVEHAQDVDALVERALAAFAEVADTRACSARIVRDGVEQGTYGAAAEDACEITLHVDERLAVTFRVDVPSPERRVLVDALARHVALALRVVIARQEEQGARQLAAAIARLSGTSRRTLERLAADRDVHAFLGHVTLVAAETFGAASAAIWLQHNGKPRLELMLEDGVVRTVEDGDPTHAFRELPSGAGFLPLRKGDVRIHDIDDVEYDPYPQLREYLRARGLHGTATVPMYLGEELRGGLALRFHKPRKFSRDETELAHALANQAVIALELTRLSRAARAAAVVEERNRLARDIHDGIAQGLAAIVRQLESATAAGSSAAALRHVAIATELARESLVEARRSISALRPMSLEGRSLADAVRDAVRRGEATSSASLRLRVVGADGGVPSDVEDELLRIVTEAINNAIRHASPKTIEIELAFEGASVRATVRDDGIGFDAAQPRSGIGLTAMHERAQHVGAALTIASEPGAGTEVLVYWAKGERA